MKRLAVNGIGLFLFVAASFVLPFQSSAYSIVSSHPRLYLTSTDLPSLRGRITTTHRPQWQALLSWSQPDANAFGTYSGRDSTRTHRYIERNAFLYLMLADSNPTLAEQHAQIAKNWMMELAAFDFTTAPNDAFEFLWALAIGYDWLYGWPGFTETEKQQVRNQLVERTDIHVNKTGLDGFSSFPKGPATSKSIYDNMSTENNMANAFVGLAIWEPDNRYGTNASAQRYMDAAYFPFSGNVSGDGYVLLKRGLLGRTGILRGALPGRSPLRLRMEGGDGGRLFCPELSYPQFRLLLDLWIETRWHLQPGGGSDLPSLRL